MRLFTDYRQFRARGCIYKDLREDILPKIKGIPVIIVSAKVDMDNKISLLLGGAVDYVTKPFNMRELLARIAIHLKNSEKMETSL